MTAMVSGTKKGAFRLDDSKLTPRCATTPLAAGVEEWPDRHHAAGREPRCDRGHGQLVTWISARAWAFDPARPDPGHITVRRLNRSNTQHTIRELLGIDFDTQKEFPPDDRARDSTILGDVLTISPCARALPRRHPDYVAKAVAAQPRAVAEQPVFGRQFATVKMEAPPCCRPRIPVTRPGPSRQSRRRAIANSTAVAAVSAPPPADTALVFKRPPPKVAGDSLDLSYYHSATVRGHAPGCHAGQYQLR